MMNNIRPIVVNLRKFDFQGFFTYQELTDVLNSIYFGYNSTKVSELSAEKQMPQNNSLVWIMTPKQC